MEVDMKKFVIAATAAFALSIAALPALAEPHGNGSRGGGSWHGGGGSSWHGGGWRHGGSHIGLGLSFGFPAYYYWGPGYYPYAYAYPYPYAYDGGYSYDDGAPQTYIQRDSGDEIAPANPAPRHQYSNPAQRNQYSYYCTDPAGYYPQIATCPSGWLTVVPNGSPRAAPAPR
jgi:hypothetical protein